MIFVPVIIFSVMSGPMLGWTNFKSMDKVSALLPDSAPVKQEPAVSKQASITEPLMLKLAIFCSVQINISFFSPINLEFK